MNRPSINRIDFKYQFSHIFWFSETTIVFFSEPSLSSVKQVAEQFSCFSKTNPDYADFQLRLHSANATVENGFIYFFHKELINLRLRTHSLLHRAGNSNKIKLCEKKVIACPSCPKLSVEWGISFFSQTLFLLLYGTRLKNLTFLYIISKTGYNLRFCVLPLAGLRLIYYHSCF